MRNSGLFLNMAERCFLFVFSGFNVFVVCLCVCVCVWWSCKSVKNACFPQFWRLFLWGFFLIIRFRCFCVSCFWFIVGLFYLLVLFLILFWGVCSVLGFLALFLLVIVWLFVCLCWIVLVFWVLSCCVFLVCFSVVLCVRWSGLRRCCFDFLNFCFFVC